MLRLMNLLLQAPTQTEQSFSWWDRLVHFVDTPAPYSPFSEYLLVMFVLWIVARRANRKDTFDGQAQEVLDQKYAEGEISKKTYDKFRQEMALRPKR